MAGSSIPGRSVILSSHGDNQSLAASWGSHIWQSHRSCRQAPWCVQGQPRLGWHGGQLHPWPPLVVPSHGDNQRGRRGCSFIDIHIHILASSLNLHQAPGENIAGHLASKSAGHVNKHALPYCPAPLEHIAVRSMNLDSTARKLRIERTARRLPRAKRSLRRRPRQCLRERTISFGR